MISCAFGRVGRAVADGSGVAPGRTPATEAPEPGVVVALQVAGGIRELRVGEVVVG